MSFPSQGALEQVTEMLAEVVARPHLRKPRSEIIRLTREARNKRTKLLETKDHLRDSPPPPLPRRRYSGQQFSLLRDSDNEDNFTSFQRILRRIDDVSHDRSHDRSADVSHNQGNEDNELLRALEISRQEFAADEQLKEGLLPPYNTLLTLSHTHIHSHLSLTHLTHTHTSLTHTHLTHTRTHTHTISLTHFSHAHTSHTHTH